MKQLLQAKCVIFGRCAFLFHFKSVFFLVVVVILFFLFGCLKPVDEGLDNLAKLGTCLLVNVLFRDLVVPGQDDLLFENVFVVEELYCTEPNVR